MRAPQQLHITNKLTALRQTKDADPSPTPCAHRDPTIEMTPPQLPSTTTTPCKTITPPYASDVITLKSFDPTPKSPVCKPRMSQKLSTRNKAMHKKHNELQKTKNDSSFAPAAPTHNVVVLETNKKKCGQQPPPRLHGMDPNKIPFLKGLLDTYTDEQLKATIKKLQEAWKDLNEKGTVVTTRQLLMAAWGDYKDDHNALYFQEAILSTRAHPHAVTQYDTLLTQ